MKNVMINAYTKFNLGDDLFIKVLCERYPRTNFFIYAPKDYSILFDDLENLKVIPSDDWFLNALEIGFKKLKGYSFNKRRIAKKNDAVVYIGGSLFIQNDHWKENFTNIKSLKLKDQPFFLLGSNFGPYEDEEYYLTYKELFKEYTDICFREEYSYNLFKELDNVRAASDIVFQLQKKSFNDIKTKNIAISVIKPSIRKNLKDFDQVYYEKIKQVSMDIIDRGFEVTLMSFCEHEGDEEAVNTIYDMLSTQYKNKTKKFYYKLNIAEALSIIAKSSCVIATRFHSMILGLAYNKPVFPIIYSDKMKNVMNDIDFKGSYCDLKNINALEPEIVYNSLSSNLVDISKEVKNSEKHFEKLDDYLLS